MATESNGKVLLRVRPRGFCAGVVRAVDIVELALEAYGAPVYVHHEIVHNTYVVEQLRRRGAILRCWPNAGGARCACIWARIPSMA